MMMKILKIVMICSLIIGQMLVSEGLKAQRYKPDYEAETKINPRLLVYAENKLEAPFSLFPDGIMREFSNTTTLTWGEVKGAKGYIVEFEYCTPREKVWFGNFQETTTTAFFKIESSEGLIVRWRVTAIDENNEKGEDSDWRKFRYL